jgi:hypothetical protein
LRRKDWRYYTDPRGEVAFRSAKKWFPPALKFRKPRASQRYFRGAKSDFSTRIGYKTDGGRERRGWGK